MLLFYLAYTSLQFWRQVTITKIRMLLIVLAVRKNMRLPERVMQGYQEFSSRLLQSSTNYTRALL